MRRAPFALVVCAAALVAAGTAPTPDETRTRWRERLAGRHFVAKVHLDHTMGADTERRSLAIWRDDGEAGERLMARFETPEHLRDFAILFLEQSGKPNDYFVYQPTLRRVRRVSERTASEDIYGVDLEVLAFGVAQSVATEVESVAAIAVDGRPVLRLVERALEGNQRFDRRIAELDRETFVPLRVEHQRGGETVLVATIEAIETVQGVATPTRMRFVRPKDGSEVVMVVESIDYEKPIPGAFFSTIALVNR